MDRGLKAHDIYHVNTPVPPGALDSPAVVQFHSKTFQNSHSRQRGGRTYTCVSIALAEIPFTDHQPPRGWSLDCSHRSDLLPMANHRSCSVFFQNRLKRFSQTILSTAKPSSGWTTFYSLHDESPSPSFRNPTTQKPPHHALHSFSIRP